MSSFLDDMKFLQEYVRLFINISGFHSYNNLSFFPVFQGYEEKGKLDAPE